MKNLLTVFVLANLVCNLCAAQSPRSQAFLDAIEAGVTVGKALSPLDVTGITTLADEFEQTIVGTEKIRFRCYVNDSSETVLWAVERCKEENLGDKKASKVAFTSTIIRGKNAVTWTGSVVPERNTFESFDQATYESFIPIPSHWALLPFPFFGNPDAELRRLESEANESSSTVSVREKPDSIRFSVRTDRAAKSFDIRDWEFELPNYRPTFIRLQRAADGTPLTYFDQRVTWKSQDGKDVPLLITGESLVIREKKIGKATRQATERHRIEMANELSRAV